MTVAGAPLLRLDNVGVSFATGLFSRRMTMALRGACLDLAPATTLAVVGESGSGKSTLGRVAAGLLAPSSGRVLYRGHDLALCNGRGRDIRRRVQVIFQDADGSLNPRLTVRQLLLEPLAVNGQAPADPETAVAGMLGQVGLTADLACRRPFELSGGQRQRVGIARALCLSPELVVADEPAASLDRSIQALTLGLFLEYQRRRGAAFLYISHDLATVRFLAHRVAVMYAGAIVESGPVEAVLDQPAHPYARRLVAADPALQPLGGRPVPPPWDETASLSPRPDGCAFSPLCSEAAPMCRREAPPWRRLGPRRHVACHQRYTVAP